MGMDWEPWPPLQRKSNHVFVKLLVLVLLLGLSFRLLFSRSAVFVPVSESPAAVAETPSSTAVVVGVVGDAQPRKGAGSFARKIYSFGVGVGVGRIASEIFENDDGESKSENRLHTDTLDKKWTSQYNNFDYVVISGGQWFLKTAIYVENNTVIGCHYCPKLNMSEVSLEYAYSKIINSVYNFVTTSGHKPVVIYRTWTPDHFEYGEWFSGGVCNRTVPYKIGEFNGSNVDHMMRKIELEEFRRAVVVDGSETGARLKLLDTYQLSWLRPDAHSGPYRKFHPFDKDKNAKVQNDCLHWCLPGAIDTWNDLIMELILGE
ncbi:hypothetical protein BHM03_00009621 [Ensete ventricosum]|nr:hypothetical protein BHM03_00009621 [Ensete ventricosum]